MLLGLVGICVGTYAVPRHHRARGSWRCRCSALGVAVAVGRAAQRRSPGRAHPLPPRPVALARARGRRRPACSVAVRRLVDEPATRSTVAYPPLDAVPASSAALALGRGRGRRCSARSARRRPAPARHAAGGGRMIELRGIRFAYDDGPAVLDGVDLTVDEGELVLVSGPTGVGKSTLLGVVTGLVPRFSGGTLDGDVLLDGVSIVHTPPRERAHAIGYVGQNPAAGFVTDTVEEELAYGMEQLGLPPETMRRRVEETLDLLGIADLRAPRPAHPLRRPAAAGRDRLGAHHAPAAARARRADLGARPDRRRGGARDADPAGPRPRGLGAARRAPARAGGPVRRPDVPARPAPAGCTVGEPGDAAGHLARRAPDRRAGPGRRLDPAAAQRPRRPPAGPRPGRPARRAAGRRPTTPAGDARSPYAGSRSRTARPSPSATSTSTSAPAGSPR